MIKLLDNNASAGISEFQWSTSEQVWPFEKAADGATLYCKEIDLGTVPNNGTKNVAHGVTLSSTTTTKFIEYKGFMWLASTGADVFSLPEAHPVNVGYGISLRMSSANFTLQTVTDYSLWTAKVRVIYTK